MVDVEPFFDLTSSASFPPGTEYEIVVVYKGVIFVNSSDEICLIMFGITFFFLHDF